MRKVEEELRDEKSDKRTGKLVDDLEEKLTKLIWLHRGEWRKLLMRGAWLFGLGSLAVLGAGVLLGYNVGMSWGVLDKTVLELRADVDALESTNPHH